MVHVNTSHQKKNASIAEGSVDKRYAWDEANRLSAASMNGYVSNYWYDASGERVVKVNGGDNESMFVDGVYSGARTGSGNFTAYVSPYLVVSKGGQYTKHIYIGSQRIVSKLGISGNYGPDPRQAAYAGSDISGASVDYADKYAQSQQSLKNRYEVLEIPYGGTDNADYVNGDGFIFNNEHPHWHWFWHWWAQPNHHGNHNPEAWQYYYHSDHLGSSSLITNLNGETVQHVEYVPFGEVFFEERNNRWNTPYLFNAKELDEETGLYYYGARYYEPRTSLWLGVDPLAEKYPGISPFAYTLNNPIRFIDPEGMDVWELDGEGNVITHIKDTSRDAFYFVSKTGDGSYKRRLDPDDDNKKELCISFDYGTVTKQYEAKTTVLKDGKNEERNMTIFEIKGDKEATQLFELLADNTKATNVEWTHAKTGTEESGHNIIGTSHKETLTSVGVHLLNNGYTLREVNHNHPNKTKDSSVPDKVCRA